MFGRHLVALAAAIFALAAPIAVSAQSLDVLDTFPKLAPNGSASAPSYSFAGTPNTGFYTIAGGIFEFSASGAQAIRFGGGGISLLPGGSFSASSNGAVAFSSGTAGSAANDVILRRDAAAALALRDGANPQAIRVYNTYTDPSNYERANLIWSGNNFDIFPSATGTGVSSRNIRVYASTGGALQVGGGGTIKWEFSSPGHFLAAADNTYDIGATGANRPRNYWGAGSIKTALGSVIGWASGPQFTGSGTDKIIAQTSTGTGVATVEAQYFGNVAVPVASLQPCTLALTGLRAFVNNATATTYASAVAGGGANHGPVYCDGGTTTWRIG